ncbi:MAG: hypothetical protein IJR42_01215 [Paludibacteraceae bacterium]|nr:hypothetical protein [Paludibacteraceae bacterium]
MNINDYMNRQEGRKANGQFSREALNRMADKLRDVILNLKQRWYTSPKDYGQALANRPRHAHAKGRRVLHTTNF